MSLFSSPSALQMSRRILTKVVQGNKRAVSIESCPSICHHLETRHLQRMDGPSDHVDDLMPCEPPPPGETDLDDQAPDLPA